MRNRTIARAERSLENALVCKNYRKTMPLKQRQVRTKAATIDKERIQSQPQLVLPDEVETR